MIDQDFFDSICNAPLLPTVHPFSADILCGFADVLFEENYAALEVLARPLHEVMAAMREVIERPQRRKILWGVGTMRSRRDALEAIELKPDFLVSPAFSRHVLDAALEANIPYIPAVHTFQDVQNVIDAFADRSQEVRILKLCPVYGLSSDYVRSLCGCFPGIVFCPTGEITMENYYAWKRTPGIIAPMGSRLVPKAWLEAGDWNAARERLRLIRRLAEEADDSRL